GCKATSGGGWHTHGVGRSSGTGHVPQTRRAPLFHPDPGGRRETQHEPNRRMRPMGQVMAVCISEKKGTQKKNVNTATFVEDWGIQGDAHAGMWHRQVSLLSHERVEVTRARGAVVAYWVYSESLVATRLGV